jgi:hypothetical protein
MCAAHLSGALRMVVAFFAQDVAAILLVGPHDNGDPYVDVYTQLYALAGLASPPAGERAKPPCCGAEDGRAPIQDEDLLNDFVRRARQLSGADRRRAVR